MQEFAPQPAGPTPQPPSSRLPIVRSAGPALVAAPGEWAVAGPVADLERLARLFDAGHLTAEEFRAAKAAVLENR